jgi:hypothetical protein
MEKAGPLAALHYNLGIPGPVDDTHGVPVGLRTIGHESFKIRLWDSVSGHDVVEVVPKEHLGIFILQLEVTAGNRHDALIGGVIDMGGHGGPTCDSLDMVGHDPCSLEITAGLHTMNQVDTTPGANFGHLENEDLVRVITLAGELVSLNVSPTTNTSKPGDAIHDSESPQVLE